MYLSLKVSFLILFCLVRAGGCRGDDWPVLGTACHFGVLKNFIHICVPINVCVSLLTLTYMFMLFSLWLAIGNPCRIVVQPTGECSCKTMSELEYKCKKKTYAFLFQMCPENASYQCTSIGYVSIHACANAKCSLVWYMYTKRFLEDWLNLQWSSIKTSQTASDASFSCRALSF